MVVKNNYKECITNFACSIRKYFNLEYKHNTLEYVDKLLEDKNPKNVVVILIDGMGSRILDRILKKEDFLNSNRYKEITTVFPATTTAATTSMITGLNPVEHGFLGWYSYIKPLDQVIMLFTGINKDTQELCKEYDEVRKKYLNNKTITDEINEKCQYQSKMLYPFGENKYADFDDMLNKIKFECQKDGKKYIYAYDDKVDYNMHLFGPDSSNVIDLVKEINNKLEVFSKELKDTVIFIVADYGHIKVDNIFLKDYPDLVNMLERNTSLEERAMSFKVKEGLEEKFKLRFNELFGQYFKLYTKEEIINSKIFGDGDKNLLFESSLGDFIAIAENSNKALLMDGDESFYSHHAGYTDDEVYIPLIIVDRI